LSDIVLDNSVISAFCEIGRFDLLKEILSRLELEAVVPGTVEKEIVFNDAILAITPGKPGREKWIKVLPVSDHKKHIRKLHGGEAGVIALARRNDSIAALDDRVARRAAREEGIRITGTLGLLKIGYEICPIKDKTELAKIIHELKGVWFRMTEDLEREILDTRKSGAKQ